MRAPAKKTGYTDREGVRKTLGASGSRITRTAGHRSWRKWRVEGPVAPVRISHIDEKEATR